jgi:hypothetical protein
MKTRIRFTLMVALALPGGIAMATEEPKYEVLASQGPIELRRYPAFVIAETTVEGDMDAASGKGFRAIADYIFGNNQAKKPNADTASEKIAMTAPVTMEPLTPASQKIAMTAPVAMEPLTSPAAGGLPAMQGATQWRMHFVMPSQYTLATLPQPNNPAVRLRQVPAKTWAVLSYSGFNTEAKIQKKTDELVTWLAGQDIQTVGSPQLARYDPPWTLPMFRRNEIMLEIQQP